MTLSGKNILFISASFFDYEKAIKKQLENMEANVDFFDERPSNSILMKGIIRVNRKYVQKIINRYYENILKKISDKSYDFFLLIKGESVPIFFLEVLRKNNPSIKMIYYTYDSFEEYPALKGLLKFFDEKFTFDRNDAKQYGLHFRPLFFTEEYFTQNLNSIDFDVAFIGSAHTDRYVVGENVKIECDKMNLKSFFYYYTPGKLAFKLKKLTDKKLKNFDLKKLSYQKLTHKQIIEIYSKSKVILDINKPFQNGLTMRTFEALALGKKLITTNKDIVNYPFFHPQNILVIDRENISINKDFFKSEFIPLTNDTLEKMSLSSWVECLFYSNQDQYWL